METTMETDQAEADPAALADDAQADGQADALAHVSELEAQLAQTQEALADVTAERDALVAAADKADKAPRSRAAPAEKRRKIGPVKGDALTPAELLQLVQEAQTVEVAFSDGRNELVDVPAQVIEGNAWMVGPSGMLLRLSEMLMHGPLPGKGAHSLDGYGLILDGKLVAYRARENGPLTIPAGTRMNLAADVQF